MVTAYYYLMLAASLVLMIVYFAKWHKHFDVHITLIFVLVPVANLGTALVAFSQSLETALASTKIAYIGGCYLLLILMLAVFSLCDIKVNRGLRIALVCLSTVVYLSVLSIGYSTLYYQSATIEQIGGVTVLESSTARCIRFSTSW